MTMTRDEAISTLKDLVPQGSTVWCVLEHVSQSGMTRDIKLFVIRDNDLWHLSYYVEQAGLYKRAKGRDGVRIGGCGMDMGFAIVYDLAMTLYGDGYCLSHRWL